MALSAIQATGRALA